ncbi:tripartite tricarboxylate transporter substrate binding protein [Variovorax sp. YR216]|uniref:tripartite tricarboxylate transporter substrate binding protein n=1 Tax=Variovorax sp. YR216 TaxID=1882828 RepID=UPI00089C66D0|nr:tripartite tricarboxylate transporter substrate binding protein [Variovorax sp. YR216]SEB06410.1 Tripartite-type tricarboxylate transporter, receptor component TctC [Variovorax sp. YR216]
MFKTRRAACAAIAASALLGVSATADVAYPTRPIKIVIGFAPGGSTDAPMRVLAEAVSKTLKQPVIIENRPGAGGTLPGVVLQNASNDGYTLGIASLGIYRLPFTTDIKWNPAKDLTYIIGLTGYAFGIVVPSSSSIKTWTDYVSAAKAKPGQLTYGSPGVATTNHLTMEQISRKAGIRLNHIPYKGTGETIQALLGAQIDSAAETSAWAPFVKEGKMRLLVTWGDRRMASFPDVPTLREVGIPITQTSHWGLVAPKGMDPAIVSKLHDAFKTAMQQPEFKQVLARYDMEPDYKSSADFHKFAIDTMKQEKEILDELGLSRN